MTISPPATLPSSRAEVISFDRFSLSPYSGELRSDDSSVMLGRRTLRLLLTLINARGALVTNEDLLDHVWPKLVVEPNTLQVHISILRKALGSRRQLLKTYKGRGYALLVADSEQPVNGHHAQLQSSSHDIRRPNFIGRAREIEALIGLARSTRLMTLVGPGGVGKTRLALELAERLVQHDQVKLCVVDLTPLGSGALLPNITAAAIGVGGTSNDDLFEAIVASLEGKARLMLFDNCEYLAPAVGDFSSALLERVGDLRVMATSQRSLGAKDETLVRVEPLSLYCDASATSDAVSFFVDRAAALDRSFSMDGHKKTVVAKICEALDGMPLAIEMAVARLRVLGLDALYASLDMRLQLLKTTPGEGNGRYPTIRAMLDWNHGLLDEAGQQLFRRLAIFPASFSLDAALSVATFEAADRWRSIDALSDLVDKSLVTLLASDPPRYRLLETMRLYGLEKLDLAGETSIASRQHANYYCELFDNASDASEVTLPDSSDEFSRGEFDNIRAAMQWALAEPERSATAVSLAGAASPVWRGFSFAEGRNYVDRGLELVDASTPPAHAARLYKQAGTFWYMSDEERGLRMYEAAAAAYRLVPDPSNLAQMLSILGHLYSRQNRQEESKAVLTEALQLIREGKGKRINEVITLSGLGILHSALKQPDEARRLFLEARQVAREIGDAVQEQVALANLSELEYQYGEIELAIEIVEQVIANVTALAKGGTEHFIRALTTTLASYLMLASRTSESAVRLRHAMRLAIEQGGHGVTACVELCAYLAVEQNAPARAGELIGFASQRYTRGGALRSLSEEAVQTLVRRRIAELLGEEALAHHLLAGSRWTEEYAVSVASGYLEQVQVPNAHAALAQKQPT